MNLQDEPTVAFDSWGERLASLVLGLPLGVQVSLGLGLGAAVLALLIVAWLRLPLRFRHRMRLALTVVSGGAAVLLGYVALGLPEGRMVRFSVEHQLIRSGAMISATLFTVLALWAGVPLILTALERGGFEAFVAARHLRSKKSGFLTAISALSILGVGLSSFALCTVISVMGGFGADLKDKILNNDAHIRIESTAPGGIENWSPLLERVRTTPGVRAAMPVITGEVMASSSTNTAGMIVRGIDPAVVRQVIDIPSKVEVGSFEYLTDPDALSRLPANTPIGLSKSGEVYYKGPGFLDDEEDAASEERGLPGAVLGSELADSLHVFVGDVIRLVSPMGDLGPMGLLPKTRRFRVAGIFHSGMYEYDAAHAYITLESAAMLLDLGEKISTVDVRVTDIAKVSEITPRIAERQKPFESATVPLRYRDWKEMNKNLFTALELEKIASFVVLSIAIAVASFCIICTLLLMVTEKSKEIAIMKAMGASDRTVLSLFITEGMLIGSVGTVIGVASGFVAMKGLDVYGLRLNPEVYYVERLPVNVDVLDYLLIALCAFVITTLATLYPARAASLLRPVEGIRHE